ncbi:hypothetical protein ACFSDD_17780 [Salipiger marinus]|uniref:hypothetical protein n=1 Tax=Salipiger marinus TaxID=555512 RepID=UPI002C51D0E6|nr:hypothetical protein [Salipiger manganoxidans]MEB3421734.1 hypothetical protein [Salipiger manganoxidans]
MKAVIFNRAHLMYQRGETAGFPDDHAQKLIAAGIARDPEASLPLVGELGPELVSLSGPGPQASEAGADPKAAGGQDDDPAGGGGKAEGVEDTASAPEAGAKPAAAKADEPGAPPAQGKRR